MLFCSYTIDMDKSKARERLISLVLDGRREKANSLLDEYTKEHGIRQSINEVLEPVLEEIGLRWSEENLSLAQGYIAGKVAEDLLLKLDEDESKEGVVPVSKGPVVLGNIEDDYHSLGRKLVSIFLRTAGWRVIDLGNDVVAEKLVDAAVEAGARIIGVSAMMYTTASNIRKVRTELDRRGLSGSICLAVGGAVFKYRPELVPEVGGDGTAANGFEVPRLFDSLWAQALASSSR